MITLAIFTLFAMALILTLLIVAIVAVIYLMAGGKFGNFWAGLTFTLGVYICVLSGLWLLITSGLTV